MKITFLLLAFFFAGCSFKEEGIKFLPINPKELLYHKGDVLAFKIDSSATGAALVIGYAKEDQNDIWYDLVFTDYLASQPPTLSQIKQSRVVGRKVESSLDQAGFVACLDVEAVHSDCLRANAFSFQLIGQLPLDTAAVKLGSQGAVSNYQNFISSFRTARERRTLPPDHYTEQLKLDKFRPDEYFAVQSYLLK